MCLHSLVLLSVLLSVAEHMWTQTCINLRGNFKNVVMGWRPSMTINKLIAIGMLNSGLSVNHVEHHFQVQVKIYHVESRYRQKDSVKDRPRCGRPKKTTQREVQDLVTSS